MESSSIPIPRSVEQTTLSLLGTTNVNTITPNEHLLAQSSQQLYQSALGDGTHLPQRLSLRLRKVNIITWIKRNGAVLAHAVLGGVHAGVDVVFHGDRLAFGFCGHQIRVPFPPGLDEVWSGGFCDHGCCFVDFVGLLFWSRGGKGFWSGGREGWGGGAYNHYFIGELLAHSTA